MDTYTAEKRQLAVGERIQLTRPWKAGSRKIANREAGTIRAMDAAGNARVELDRGTVVKWSIPRNPHVEYGYARTSYSEQSTTVPKMLLHLDMGDSRIRTLLDKALVYVGASRGEQELLVFTDDREILLGEQSPVNRVSVKPKALSREEIQECAEDMRMTV